MLGVPVKQHTDHAVVDAVHGVGVHHPMPHSIQQPRLTHGAGIKGRDEEPLPLLKRFPR